VSIASRSRFGTLRARPPHAEPHQRIGLLGGSFNPPHAAHLLISQTALKRLELDSVWWLVTPGNPLKNGEGRLPLAKRLALSRRLANDARITVTAFEEQLAGRYTVSTLAYLRRRFPATHFVWLMGADCLAGFDRWEQWREIFQMLPIAVIDRPGWRHRALASKAAQAFSLSRCSESQAGRLAATPPPAWTFLTGPLMPLSSTAIRAGQAHGVTKSSR
jgi:nicotinate-nucleotide adenylyltransferase